VIMFPQLASGLELAAKAVRRPAGAIAALIAPMLKGWAALRE